MEKEADCYQNLLDRMQKSRFYHIILLEWRIVRSKRFKIKWEDIPLSYRIRGFFIRGVAS